MSASIGDGADDALAFRIAVHLAIYAAQDMSDGPVAATTHPPKRLAEQLRRGEPLPAELVRVLGGGLWPQPPEAFSLARLPCHVPVTQLR